MQPNEHHKYSLKDTKSEGASSMFSVTWKPTILYSHLYVMPNSFNNIPKSFEHLPS